MSNVSKYANLPGIALDQPDVYETSDLPEVDQLRSIRPTSSASALSSSLASQAINDDNSSSNVNIIKTSAADAFEVFKGKVLKSSDDTNFDYLTKNLKQIGYQSYGDFEILDENLRNDETPLQRYRRLQYEVNDLVNLLNENSADGNNSGGKNENKVQPTFGNDLSKEELLNSLVSIDEQLKHLNIENCGEFNFTTGLNKIGDFNSMINALDSIKQSTPTTASTTTTVKEGESEKSNASDSVITYQLNCNPELIKLRNQTKLNQFEQRIKRIENILGNDNEKISFLTSLTNDKCLTKAIALLSEKVAQLDSTHLELLDTRLKSLLTKLNQLNEKKPLLDDLDKRSKIDELYSIVIENEKNSSALPLIANRLNSLNDLHEQAIQFSSAISYIDALQNQINETMNSNEEDLKQLKNSLNKNMIDIKAAIDSLNERFDKLSK